MDHPAEHAIKPPAQDFAPAGDPQRARAPVVSVIITCYNQSQFLEEAIESVLLQTYRNIEVILIDDGSTDATPAVAAAHGEVRYLRQDNSGLSYARNLGLRHARGVFVVFLDADDRLLPPAIEAGITFFRTHVRFGLVYGGHRLVDASGEPLTGNLAPWAPFDAYRRLLQGNFIGMHGAVMYRRGVLESMGGFDTSLRSCEDYDLYMRIACDWDIGYHGKLVAEYRRHANNMSLDRESMLRSSLQALGRQYNQIKTSDCHRRAYESGRQYWSSVYAGGDSMSRTAARSSGKNAHAAPPGASGKSKAGNIRHGATGVRQLAGRIARAVLPESFVSRLWTYLYDLRSSPLPGQVNLGHLRRVSPLCRDFGYQRGLPIDRYYIESFLARHADDIRGRVLEVGDNTYTIRFGGEKVTHNDVLHVEPSNRAATLIADLARADDIPAETFDCIILTQTLQLIYDVRGAMLHLHRILKPGGILLLTVPGVSQIDRGQWGSRWCWSFTRHSVRMLLAEQFSPEDIMIQACGNLIAAVSFLAGMATRDLRRGELDHVDPQYEMLITARAVRQAN